MAKYVDGFVIVIPKVKFAEYKKMAEEGREMWKKFGALEYMECVGDDLTARDMGGMTHLAFTQMAQAGPDEDVWFSFIVYESKQHRDEVNKKVMEWMQNDKNQENMSMPFDMKKFSYGGFEVVVDG